ncbi:2Fe-2S iron-sulfur cluster-binding protein [Deinococcus cellulosilyticus]|uniref:(2Fe-2S)-binding protein n=1 Tax=Deinococcus cellulosilyticus (strain DSM 18568 / NBRC 106333 / KACC 11606 / 5516J-15) TaxID=1223518 RepID=A0A511N5Y5_DEIC1|nr:2Fe-2S iron-sulfur cluster-binding protein [Deinococcus cellulosilyticus]GEM48270.1 (2Fe-2S)-binding protein [Deinococcus cellulosilyticus NBRC 106333 = KACC 11606]
MPELNVGGKTFQVKEGITVLAALQNLGMWKLRNSVSGEARGALCGMGVCYECRLQVDGKTEKTCQVIVQQNMQVMLNAD